ncbi:MAG: hypothetical protein K5657_06390 [Desulfovibrio sp.]|nr:hypothetical protein [Desulfovibrio sp.]
MLMRLLNLLPCLLLLFTLSACKQARSTADVPTLLSRSYAVSVAPFSQPVSTADLILGRIPEQQGKIDEESLALLDHELRRVLADTMKRRNYTFIKESLARKSINFHNAAQPQALSAWIAYGRKHHADLLLVPQVLDWHERAGSRAGVVSSASVRVEFFLLNIKKATVMGRCIFEEKQEALTDNILNIGSFIKRRGSWVSAVDLAREGMQKAKVEFGL